MEINENKKILLEKIARDYDLDLLILFGSQVTGKTHKESDFDIGYVSKKDITVEDHVKMHPILMNVLGIKSELLISLTDIKTAPPLLLKEMFEKEKHIVLYTKDRTTYDEYAIYSMKNYLDSKPLFDLRDFLIDKYFAQNA
ncbi:MAG: hypothetical protein UU24_C0041G0011 [Candidatus Nomurabacteria bacterium GW2011_GWA2_40_9]|uniref:Polymerase beta nucleotidyltransferase domain-containing protein n=1 Tax=Candidatus Nomurabacteria bacterium GW2011_GWA2_40_9 TaxID=1618734 RepID=A0A0G0W1H3_9BACT|nr:MAG: hypothetical protein UU24_C0041G0011 [Candidatus Nomurabacteria bacterium GW2011_GWA2_40_9]